MRDPSSQYPRNDRLSPPSASRQDGTAGRCYRISCLEPVLHACGVPFPNTHAVMGQSTTSRRAKTAVRFSRSRPPDKVTQPCLAAARQTSLVSLSVALDDILGKLNRLSPAVSSFLASSDRPSPTSPRAVSSESSFYIRSHMFGWLGKKMKKISISEVIVIHKRLRALC